MVQDLFKQLVQINSPSGSEERLADFIVDYLRKLGLTAQKDHNGMVFCKVGTEKSSVLFCAHMDTVQPGCDIEIQEKQGIISSLGETILGADNKAALAAILTSVANIRKEKHNFELLFTITEETTSGIQLFAHGSLEARVGFVFDGGEGDLGWLVEQAPTITDFEIELSGTAAHASEPWQGNNVMPALAELMSTMQLGDVDEHTLCNVGLIRGGSATNTVPGHATLAGDIRSTNLESYQKLCLRMQTLIRLLENKHKIKANFVLKPYASGYQLDRNSSRFELLRAVYASEGITLNPTKAQCGSDAGFLNHVGLETFCLGDGVRNSHTDNEQIAVKDLDKLTALVTKLIKAF